MSKIVKNPHSQKRLKFDKKMYIYYTYSKIVGFAFLYIYSCKKKNKMKKYIRIGVQLSKTHILVLLYKYNFFEEFLDGRFSTVYSGLRRQNYEQILRQNLHVVAGN